MDTNKPKYSKYCLVPQCKSTSIRVPEKIFISLPVGLNSKEKKKRMLWLQAMRRKKNDISENTRGYVCEDHFDLENDMENYMRFKMMGGKIKLKEHIVPHKFHCQTGRTQPLPESGATPSAELARKKIIDALLYEDEVSTKKNSISTEGEVVHTLDTKLQPLTSCKYSQTDIEVLICQRTVSVQYRPYYRSKFVQTDQVLLTF